MIAEHRNEIRYCYEKSLQVKPTLAGKIDVRFRVVRGGRVASADVVQTTLNSREVESCVTNHISSWRFPAPQGGDVVVNYPFTFAASEGQ